MNSDNDLLHQAHPIKEKPANSFKSLKLLALFGVILFTAVIAGMSGYLLGIRTSQKLPQANIVSNNQLIQIPTINPTLSSDVYAGWKTFRAPMEGFTIRYPSNWTFRDFSTADREGFSFKSPDGITVAYVFIHETDDKAECGVQSPCLVDYVDGIEKLNVSGLGEILLVKSGKTIHLHKPINSDTLPMIGENKHSNYVIDFSLPSKNGFRFILTSSNEKFNELTNEQYYNLDSVKQAILVLKSLKY